MKIYEEAYIQRLMARGLFANSRSACKSIARASLCTVAALSSFAVLALAACADTPSAILPETAAFGKAADAPHQPVRLGFRKCITDPAGIWNGAVTGDIVGDLETRLTYLEVTGAIWHVRFKWIVTADDESFVADLSGILNTATGAVVMNGTVAEGHLEGARVHEKGQLVDPENSCFEGTIRIMPATAQ